MAGFEISLVQSSEMSKNDSRTSGILAGLVRWMTAYFWFSHKLHLLCIFQTSEWYIRISDFYNPLARRSNAFNLKFLSLYGLVDLVMASFQTGLNQYWLIMNRTHYNFKLFRYLYPAHTRNFILICTTELLVLLTLVANIIAESNLAPPKDYAIWWFITHWCLTMWYRLRILANTDRGHHQCGPRAYTSQSEQYHRKWSDIDNH